jgi:hypothetical protein
MIQWIEYDKNNPPEFDKEFIVFNNGEVFIGFCSKEDNGRIVWKSVIGDHVFSGVTHFAVINKP